MRKQRPDIVVRLVELLGAMWAIGLVVMTGVWLMLMVRLLWAVIFPG